MRIKKVFIMIVIGLLLLGGLPANISAETDIGQGKYRIKDEVIYANLHADGTTKEMYVVNRFDVTKAGKMIDYGQYTEVRNLTDLTAITQKNKDEIHFEATEGKFFYQGELKHKPLPWDIAITYLLDGQEVTPEELTGQSGPLELQIETSVNDAVNPLFAEHFLLQISLTLDPEVFHNIQAPKGTEANEGENKQITFTVLPEQDETLIVSAHVEALEMEPINFAAIPANIAIEDPDFSEMTGGMSALAQAIKELHSGVIELNEGTRKLNDGAVALSRGSASYRQGVNELDQSSDQLVSGSREILEVLQMVSQEMQDSPEIDIPDLAELEKIPQGLRQLAQALDDFSPVFKQMAEAIDEIPMEIDEERLKELYELIEENDLDDDILKQLERSYEIAQQIKEMSEKIPVDAIDRIVNVSRQIESLADEIETSLKDLDQLEDLADLQAGLLTLSAEYEHFHNGLMDYTGGVHALASSYAGIDTGISGLSTGITSISQGTSSLYEGTKELRNKTSRLPEEIQSQIEAFMEEYDFASFEPASFVSDQNKRPGVVQFVLQTERLKIAAPEEKQPEEQEKKSLWTRFLDLFR